MDDAKKYDPVNGFTEEKIEAVAQIIADHALSAVEPGDVIGGLRETAKMARLTQAVLVELGLLAPADEVDQ